MFRHFRPVLRFMAIFLVIMQVITGFPVTAVAAPAPPANLTITVPVNGSQLILDWQAVSGATQYKIYQSVAGGGYTLISTVSTINFADSGLQPNTLYSYQVTAVGSDGESAAAAVSATTYNSDIIPPSAPAGLTATAQSLTGIGLSWSPSTDNVAVDEYEIYYRISTAATFTKLSTVTHPTTNFTHSGLVPGNTYYYYVRAIDTYGNPSGNSATVSAVTPADTVKPSRPDIISANVYSSSQISLTWTGAADNVGISGYRIYRKTGAANLVQIGTSSTTGYTDPNLTPGVTYIYEVSAVDISGNESDHSLPISRTTVYDIQPPPAPTGLTATVQSTNSIKLQWNSVVDNVGLGGYEVWRGTGAGNYTTRLTNPLTTATSYTDHALAANTRYYYKVVAVDTSGNVSAGAFANALTQTDTVKPTPPTMVSARVSSGKTKVYLDWSGADDNIGVVSYEVYRSAGSGSAVRIDTTHDTSYDDTEADANKTYKYYIIAVDGAGNKSAASITVTVTTNGDSEGPTIPTNLKVNLVSDNEIKLGWTASTDITGVNGYYIYRAEDDGSFEQLATATGTSFNDKDVHSGNTYRYYIKAFDTAGNTSGKSNIESIYTALDHQTMTGYISADDDGLVELPDGAVSMEMPAGAIETSALFTLTAKTIGDYDAPGFYKVGWIVEITSEKSTGSGASKGSSGSKGSTGMTLKKKATLTFEYDADDLLDYSSGKMGIYKWDSTAKTWRRLENTVKSSSHRAWADIDELGVYGLLIDTDAPKVPTFTGPNLTKALTSRVFLLKGKGEPYTKAEVSINWNNEYSFDIDAKGDFSGEVLLAQGENRLRVRGEDGAGNTGDWSEELVFRADSPVKITDTSGHWAEINIQKLVETGVAGGYADNSFRPNKTITRAEFIRFVVAATGTSGKNTGRSGGKTGKAGSTQELNFADNARIPAWAKESIAAAVKAGIIAGYADGTFKPDRFISREEMAVILVKALNLQADAAKQQEGRLTFDDDYAVSSWARGAVAIAVEKGIISGYADDNFRPAKNATRAEAATMVVKVMDQKKGKKG